MQREQGGALRFEDPHGVAPAQLVGLDVEGARIAAELGLELGEQARRGHRADQLGVIGRVRAPDLGNVPGDARADAHRPLDAGRRHPRLPGDIPESRHADVFRVPVPASLVLAPGVEGGIGEDAVHGRPHAGDERGVARIGHRRDDAFHAVGEGAVLQKAAEIGDLRLVAVRGGDVVRAEAVDGDQQEERTRRLLGSTARGEDRPDREEQKDNAGEEPPAPADGRAHARHGPVIVHPSRHAVKRGLARALAKHVRRRGRAGSSPSCCRTGAPSACH